MKKEKEQMKKEKEQTKTQVKSLKDEEMETVNGGMTSPRPQMSRPQGWR